MQSGFSSEKNDAKLFYYLDLFGEETILLPVTEKCLNWFKGCKNGKTLQTCIFYWNKKCIKALFTRDILTDNIAIKRNCDKKILR